jgi:cytochrome c oxidase cbb3-type subunit 4
MKFIHYLKAISGVEIYPLISLLIFFTFFIGLTVWVMRVNKGYLQKMENLPLEGENIL